MAKGDGLMKVLLLDKEPRNDIKDLIDNLMGKGILRFKHNAHEAQEQQQPRVNASLEEVWRRSVRLGSCASGENVDFPDSTFRLCPNLKDLNGQSRRGESHMMNFDQDDAQRSHSALHSEKIISERKIFFLDLKENERGRFIKITEDVRGRRDTIMLPIDVANDFAEALDRVLEANANLH